MKTRSRLRSGGAGTAASGVAPAANSNRRLVKNRFVERVPSSDGEEIPQSQQSPQSQSAEQQQRMDLSRKEDVDVSSTETSAGTVSRGVQTSSSVSIGCQTTSASATTSVVSLSELRRDLVGISAAAKGGGASRRRAASSSHCNCPHCGDPNDSSSNVDDDDEESEEEEEVDDDEDAHNNAAVAAEESKVEAMVTEPPPPKRQKCMRAKPSCSPASSGTECSNRLSNLSADSGNFSSTEALETDGEQSTSSGMSSSPHSPRKGRKCPSSLSSKGKAVLRPSVVVKKKKALKRSREAVFCAHQCRCGRRVGEPRNKRRRRRASLDGPSTSTASEAAASEDEDTEDDVDSSFDEENPPGDRVAYIHVGEGGEADLEAQLKGADNLDIQILEEEDLPDIDETDMIHGLDHTGTARDYVDERHRCTAHCPVGCQGHLRPNEIVIYESFKWKGKLRGRRR